MTPPATLKLPLRVSEPGTILDASDMRVADLYCEGLDDHAHFLATAANSHAALVKALECLLCDERFQVAIGGNPIAVDRMLDEARAALALAKATP